MIAGFTAWWRAIRHLNHRGYIYIWANLCCVVCSLPIITAPAAWAGLVKLSTNAYTSTFYELDDYWSGFRENLGRGLIVALLNLLIIGVNVVNLIAYQAATDTLSTVLRFFWVAIVLVWLALQFYMWPLLYQMEQPTLTGAFRNAAVMLVLNPFFTLVVMIGAGLVIVFSLIIPPTWLLLTFSVLVTGATGAVLGRLKAAGHHINLDPYHTENTNSTLDS